MTGLIAFQDGVTVQRAASPTEPERGIYCATDGWGSSTQIGISRTHAITDVYGYARMSGLHRSCAEQFITEGIRDKARAATIDPWLMAMRLNHLAALRDRHDAMMEEQARRHAAGTALGVRCK